MKSQNLLPSQVIPVFSFFVKHKNISYAIHKRKKILQGQNDLKVEQMMANLH